MVDTEYSADGKAKIPFRDGNLLGYPDWYGGAPIEWRDNYTFPAVLTYTGFYRGRSAAGLEWKDEDEHTYPMFLKDLEHALRHGIGEGGTLKAVMTFVKRGSNYGIVLAAAAPKDTRMGRRIYVRGDEDVNDLTKLRYSDWTGVAGKEVDHETHWSWRNAHEKELHSKDYPPRYIIVYGSDSPFHPIPRRYFEVRWTRKGVEAQYTDA